MSLCEINCEYQGYDIKNKIVKYECNIKNTKLFFEDKNLLLNEFKNVKEIMNIYIMKCYKSVFSLIGLKYNIGSYIVIFLFLTTVICKIYYYSKGKKILIFKINSIAKLKVLKQYSLKKKKESIRTNRNSKYKSKNNLIQLSDKFSLNRINFFSFNETINNKININKIKNKKKTKKKE